MKFNREKTVIDIYIFAVSNLGLAGKDMYWTCNQITYAKTVLETDSPALIMTNVAVALLTLLCVYQLSLIAKIVTFLKEKRNSLTDKIKLMMRKQAITEDLTPGSTLEQLDHPSKFQSLSRVKGFAGFLSSRPDQSTRDTTAARANSPARGPESLLGHNGLAGVWSSRHAFVNPNRLPVTPFPPEKWGYAAFPSVLLLCSCREENEKMWVVSWGKFFMVTGWSWMSLLSLITVSTG